MRPAQARTTNPATRRRRRDWVPHVVLAVLGILVVLYPLTLGRVVPIMCREQVMGPGDVCAKANGSQSQTYEQRLATASEAAPVIIGVGVLVAAFGTALAVTGFRRSSRTGTPR